MVKKVGRNLFKIIAFDLFFLENHTIDIKKLIVATNQNPLKKNNPHSKKTE
jgi:hypothetical protein